MDISGADLISLGFPGGKVIGVTLEIIQNEFPNYEWNKLKNKLEKVIQDPIQFKSDSIIGPIANELIRMSTSDIIELKEKAESYKIFGKENIEKGALNQMDVAMRLPITVAGALMPDAHQGYGLPIGGVLATKNYIIPCGVGVDIGRRMCLKHL